MEHWQRQLMAQAIDPALDPSLADKYVMGAPVGRESLFGASMGMPSPDVVPAARTPWGSVTDANTAAMMQDHMRQAQNHALGFAGSTNIRIAKPIRAYHGSPHSFDDFRMEKIGTGEGAQAYGHGLYFAEKEGVARSYRDALAAKPANTLNDAIAAAYNFTGPEKITTQKMRDWIIREGYPNSDLTDEITDLAVRIVRGKNPDGTVTGGTLDVYRKLEKAIGGSKGHMYEVNLHVDPNKMLDWDKPLGQQAAAVQRLTKTRHRNWQAEDALANKARELGVPPSSLPEYKHLEQIMDKVAKQNRITGADLYDRMGGGAVAADKLQKAGIQGIHYLDGSSRAAGEGSRNYVVFDPLVIELLRKYGFLPPIVGGGAAGLASASSANAQQ